MTTIAQMAKENSDNMEQIAKDTRRDNQAMRVIATMTMVYLPATFVAVSRGCPFPLPSHPRKQNPLSRRKLPWANRD